MNRFEIILRVGADLGDLTLLGRRTASGWVFIRRVVDQSPLILDEAQIEHDSEVADSWRGALRLLDRYPWHMLAPLQVHPEFAGRVFEAAAERLEKEWQSGSRRERWAELCSGRADGFGEADDGNDQA